MFSCLVSEYSEFSYILTFTNVFYLYIDIYIHTHICMYVYIYIFSMWFLFFSSGHVAGGILVPRPGIKPMPPVWEARVLTAGLPGKSLFYIFICFPVTDYGPFTSAWRTPFNISCKAGLVVINSLSFCLSGKVFTSPLILKYKFSG